MAADGQAPDPPAPILPQSGRVHQPQPGPRGEALSAGNRAGMRRQFRNPEPMSGADVRSRRGDSNSQPTVYKTAAPPLSYVGQLGAALPEGNTRAAT